MRAVIPRQRNRLRYITRPMRTHVFVQNNAPAEIRWGLLHPQKPQHGYIQYSCKDWDLIVRNKAAANLNTADGVPIIEYNPRISDIVKAMHAGDIYDRNDVLLATSDVSRLSDQKLSDQFGRLPYIEDYIMTIKKQRMYRYYPFGEHMFFMVGDYNSGLFFNSDNRGYMAEARHLTELRGYDNKKYDDNGQPIKLVLSSESYRPGRYFAANYQFVTPDSIQLRNYKDLIPYLKAGKNSK